MLLKGMKIVSFCHFLQGPASTQYLADMGADVIKIEPAKQATMLDFVKFFVPKIITGTLMRGLSHETVWQ